MLGDGPFTHHDLDTLADCVGDAWRDGAGGDWSAPAGTLEWSCARTADHAVDAVLAVGFFLASRRRDGYPEWDWSVPRTAGYGRPDLAGEAIATVGHVVSAVIAAAPPDARAVIWRAPRVEVRGPEDFAARAGPELVLHGHDVCAGPASRCGPRPPSWPACATTRGAGPTGPSPAGTTRSRPTTRGPTCWRRRAVGSPAAEAGGRGWDAGGWAACWRPPRWW
jgi:hypothetical protein